MSKHTPTHTSPSSCPLPASEVVNLYFLEHRARLLDIAAFLDRVERAKDPQTVKNDHRLHALHRAIALLTDDKPQRVKRILELFSDPTTEPIAKAGTKGATGAYPGPASLEHKPGRKPR